MYIKDKLRVLWWHIQELPAQNKGIAPLLFRLINIYQSGACKVRSNLDPLCKILDGDYLIFNIDFLVTDKDIQVAIDVSKMNI